MVNRYIFIDMKEGYSYAIIVIIFAFVTGLAFPDTIELKDGRTIVADIVGESEEAIVVSKQNGSFIYSISKDRIDTIRKSTNYEVQKRARVEKTFYRVDEEHEKERKEKLDKYASQRHKKEVLAAKRARGVIKVDFSKDQPGVVGATINSKVQVSMLIDTGASFTVISRKVANEAGIVMRDDMPKIKVVLADGTEKEATRVTLKSLNVGGAKIDNVEATIIDNPVAKDIEGLLGMSFLKYFHVKIDSNEKCLVLEKY